MARQVAISISFGNLVLVLVVLIALAPATFAGADSTNGRNASNTRTRDRSRTMNEEDTARTRSWSKSEVGSMPSTNVPGGNTTLPPPPPTPRPWHPITKTQSLTYMPPPTVASPEQRLATQVLVGFTVASGVLPPFRFASTAALDLQTLILVSLSRCSPYSVQALARDCLWALVPWRVSFASATTHLNPSASGSAPATSTPNTGSPISAPNPNPTPTPHPTTNQSNYSNPTFSPVPNGTDASSGTPTPTAVLNGTTNATTEPGNATDAPLTASDLPSAAPSNGTAAANALLGGAAAPEPAAPNTTTSGTNDEVDMWSLDEVQGLTGLWIIGLGAFLLHGLVATLAWKFPGLSLELVALCWPGVCLEFFSLVGKAVWGSDSSSRSSVPTTALLLGAGVLVCFFAAPAVLVVWAVKTFQDDEPLDFPEEHRGKIPLVARFFTSAVYWHRSATKNAKNLGMLTIYQSFRGSSQGWTVVMFYLRSLALGMLLWLADSTGLLSCRAMGLSLMIVLVLTGAPLGLFRPFSLPVKLLWFCLQLGCCIFLSLSGDLLRQSAVAALPILTAAAAVGALSVLISVPLYVIHHRFMASDQAVVQERAKAAAEAAEKLKAAAGEGEVELPPPPPPSLLDRLQPPSESSRPSKPHIKLASRLARGPSAEGPQRSLNQAAARRFAQAWTDRGPPGFLAESNLASPILPHLGVETAVTPFYDNQRRRHPSVRRHQPDSGEEEGDALRLLSSLEAEEEQRSWLYSPAPAMNPLSPRMQRVEGRPDGVPISVPVPEEFVPVRRALRRKPYGWSRHRSQEDWHDDDDGGMVYSDRWPEDLPPRPEQVELLERLMWEHQGEESFEDEYQRSMQEMYDRPPCW